MPRAGDPDGIPVRANQHRRRAVGSARRADGAQRLRRHGRVSAPQWQCPPNPKSRDGRRRGQRGGDRRAVVRPPGERRDHIARGGNLGGRRGGSSGRAGRRVRIARRHGRQLRRWHDALGELAVVRGEHLGRRRRVCQAARVRVRGAERSSRAGGSGSAEGHGALCARGGGDRPGHRDSVRDRGHLVRARQAAGCRPLPVPPQRPGGARGRGEGSR